MKINIMIQNVQTGKPETKAIIAIAVFPFSFPSGHVDLFAITDAQGQSALDRLATPYALTHVASGYRCGDCFTVATTRTAREHLSRLLDKVGEPRFMSAMRDLPCINTVHDSDLL